MRVTFACHLKDTVRKLRIQFVSVKLGKWKLGQQYSIDNLSHNSGFAHTEGLANGGTELGYRNATT